METDSRIVRVGFLFHRVTNPVVRLILRSPLHPLLSGKLILVTYVGRRSGLKHTLPVMYANWDGELVVIIGYHGRKKWWLNLRKQPAPVEVRYRGKLLEASAVAIEGDADVIAPRLARYCEKFPSSARKRRIEPGSPMDLEALKAKCRDEVMVTIRPSTQPTSV
jgi:deazaflavin-dependent oxidoreductase (nitroreductase family)